MSRFYEQIRRYYVEGYGMPKTYYTDAQLDAFAAKKMITKAEAEKIRAEKKALEAGE